MNGEMYEPPPRAIRHQPDPALGPMLKTARARAELGMREAARRVGIAPSYLCELESGTRCPSVTVGTQLFQVLGLNEEEGRVLAASVVADRGRDHPLRRREAA